MFIRPWVDRIGKDGSPERSKKTIVLGGADMGKREAITEKNKVMATINRADYVIQSQIPFASLLCDYRHRHIAKLSASTQAKYEAHIKNHIEKAFAGLMLCEITSRKVEDWLDSKSALSWYTRTDLRNIMSSVFTKAIDWGLWSDRNPIEIVTTGRKRTKREQTKLSDEQTRLFIAAQPYDVRLLCCACLFCTLRISEALGLQEKHLDFSSGMVLVRQRFYRGDLDILKTNKSRRDLPMGYLIEDFRRLVTGDPNHFVFEVKTRPKWGREEAICRDDRDINQHFLRPIAKELGFYFEGFGFHSLRREAVTEYSGLLGVGQAMNMAGHTSMEMSLLYTLSDRKAQDLAVRGFQERILGKPEGSVQ